MSTHILKFSAQSCLLQNTRCLPGVRRSLGWGWRPGGTDAEGFIMQALCLARDLGGGGAADRGEGQRASFPNPHSNVQPAKLHTDMTGDCKNAPQTMWLMYRDPLQRSWRVSKEGSRDMGIRTEYPKRNSFGGTLIYFLCLSPSPKRGGGTRKMKHWALAISLE